MKKIMLVCAIIVAIAGLTQRQSAAAIEWPNPDEYQYYRMDFNIEVNNTSEGLWLKLTPFTPGLPEDGFEVYDKSARKSYYLAETEILRLEAGAKYDLIFSRIYHTMQEDKEKKVIGTGKGFIINPSKSPGSLSLPLVSATVENKYLPEPKIVASFPQRNFRIVHYNEPGIPYVTASYHSVTFYGGYHSYQESVAVNIPIDSYVDVPKGAFSYVDARTVWVDEINKKVYLSQRSQQLKFRPPDSDPKPVTCPPCPTPASVSYGHIQPVPTINAWGQAIALIALLGVGIRRIRRR